MTSHRIVNIKQPLGNVSSRGMVVPLINHDPKSDPVVIMIVALIRRNHSKVKLC